MNGDLTVLCLHETATAAEIWVPLAERLEGRAGVVAFDRRGWGRSGAPDVYGRTTVSEQAADAEAVIKSLRAGPLTVCGAGFGAIVALELALRRPELIAAVVLLEPPLLGLVPEATAAISADVEALRSTATAAVDRRGPRSGEQAGPDRHGAANPAAEAAAELYLSGVLTALGAGAERIPAPLAEGARTRPLSLFAEISAVSNWTLPLGELGSLQSRAAVVCSASTPAYVRRAGEELAARLSSTGLRDLPGAGLPQLDAPEELAELVIEVGGTTG